MKDKGDPSCTYQGTNMYIGNKTNETKIFNDMTEGNSLK